MYSIHRFKGRERVYEVSTFQKDFKSVFGKDRGNSKRYYEWLTRCTEQLDAFGMDVLQLDRFEKLKGTDPVLYSIRYESVINIRVIYFVITEIGVVLLTAFKEKSTEDYKREIIASYNIIEQLRNEARKKGNENE